MSERYPAPITNFETWYGDHMRAIKNGKSEHEITAAVEAIRPYAVARWCWPSRLEEAEALAANTAARLRRERMMGSAA